MEVTRERDEATETVHTVRKELEGVRENAKEIAESSSATSSTRRTMN